MKKIVYNFTSSDIDTCKFALENINLLLEDTNDIQNEINLTCAISIAEKIIFHTNTEPVTKNELRVLYCCIEYCWMICNGTLDADPDTRRECMKYIFSLNKLHNELCSQLL